jgi:hypothetical protein
MIERCLYNEGWSLVRPFEGRQTHVTNARADLDILTGHTWLYPVSTARMVKSLRWSLDAALGEISDFAKDLWL